jgi:hypothetical protein
MITLMRDKIFFIYALMRDKYLLHNIKEMEKR